MRTLFSTLGLLAVAVSTAQAAPAIEDPKAPTKVIENAIKAYGGEEKLAKLDTSRTKAKGSIEVMGLSVEVTMDLISHKDKMKMSLNLDVMGNQITVVQGFDGEKGWVQAMGTDIELDADQQTELKESAYLSRVTSLVPLLKDDKKEFTIDALGESKVDGKAAVGLKVKSKNHKDITMFFNKETGLMIRYEREALDEQKNKVNQSTVMEGYKDFDGVKQPTKVKVFNGDTKFMEFEVTELEFLKKVDENEFKKPK